MPDYHGEGGATANTERYRELVALRKRGEEMARHLRVIHAPVPEPEPEPEPEGETQGAPRTQRRRRQQKAWPWPGPENPTRPRRSDRQAIARVKRELYPGILYGFNAERAMVRDAEDREKREEARDLIDDICGPRKRRKR